MIPEMLGRLIALQTMVRMERLRIEGLEEAVKRKNDRAVGVIQPITNRVERVYKL
jgi:hypothetical protein